MTETKAYSAMLYALADEMRREEGCVTESPERVEQAATHLDELTTELEAISAAIGTNLYLDPPDGGDVPLHEQVRRMRDSLATVTQELGELKSAIKDGVDGALWQAHIEREAELAACEKERGEWKATSQSNFERYNEMLQGLAASQHCAQQLREALENILNGDVGTQTLWKLGRGQGTDTDDGRAWLHASALFRNLHDTLALDALVSDAQRWAAVSGLMFACQTIELEQTEEGGYRISASEPVENYLPTAWEGDTPEEAIDKALGNTKQTKPSRIYNSLIKDAIAKDATRYDAVRKAFTNGGLMINGEDLADVLFEQGTPEKFDATVDAAINVIIDAVRKGE